MSAPEAPAAGAARSVRLGRCQPDILELASCPGAAHSAAAGAASSPLPAFGRVARAPDGLTLCVRPERWLVLSSPGAHAGAASAWIGSGAGARTLVDLSSALSAFILAGPATPDVLRRGCRLDLDPAVVAPGSAAATIMAQVAVTLAVLPAGVLLLTPSSTARHFHEWLSTAARPFDLTLLAGVSLKDVCGERSL